MRKNFKLFRMCLQELAQGAAHEHLIQTQIRLGSVLEGAQTGGICYPTFILKDGAREIQDVFLSAT